jgi:hypothetical protein
MRGVVVFVVVVVVVRDVDVGGEGRSSLRSALALALALGSRRPASTEATRARPPTGRCTTGDAHSWAAVPGWSGGP